MSKIISKNKVLLVMILLISLFVFIYRAGNNGLNGTTQIFEIKNTEEVYNYPDSKVITIIKHCMITNPPKDLHKLKIVIENYIKDNPVDKGIVIDENKNKRSEVFFYRESRKLPKNWQPNEGYLSTDKMGYHKSDLIGAVYWSDSEMHKKYDVIKKGSDKSNYGIVIESIEYLDNEIVNQEPKKD